MANFDWLNLFINWFPMLLLIAVWVFFLRRMGYGRGGYVTQYQKDHMAQMQKQTAALEQIAAQMDRLSPR